MSWPMIQSCLINEIAIKLASCLVPLTSPCVSYLDFVSFIMKLFSEGVMRIPEFIGASWSEEQEACVPLACQESEVREVLWRTMPLTCQVYKNSR